MKKLSDSIIAIKKGCFDLLEDQFIQQYHDVDDDELHDPVKRCEGDPGGEELARLTVEICEKYLEGRRPIVWPGVSWRCYSSGMARTT
jgi:hypothetical protein